MSKINTTKDDYKLSFGEAINIIIALVAISALIFSHTSFDKLLPVHESNIVFSEKDINITTNYPNINGERFDVIDASFSNVGKINATNIMFTILLIPFDSDIVWGNGYRAQKSWDDGVVHALTPDGSASFGKTKIPYLMYKNDEVLDLSRSGKEKVALIFCLNYQDLISQKKKNDIFLFQYVIGNSKARSLLVSEYEDIKDDLIESLKKSGAKNCPIEKFEKFSKENLPVDLEKVVEVANVDRIKLSTLS